MPSTKELLDELERRAEHIGKTRAILKLIDFLEESKGVPSTFMRLTTAWIKEEHDKL